MPPAARLPRTMTGNEWHSRACSSQPGLPAAGTVKCLLLLGSPGPLPGMSGTAVPAPRSLDSLQRAPSSASCYWAPGKWPGMSGTAVPAPRSLKSLQREPSNASCYWAPGKWPFRLRHSLPQANWRKQQLSSPALCVMGTGDVLSLGQLTLPGPYVLWELEVPFLWVN
ncbi:hypothetical protein BB8028_0002g06820 [Beauveria bassiana]|uniref:Uncharacterized protein n=1 Tax=Beauveria bassiana TaxID=176275 RepID=A0A2S7Y2H0_BEABA|nr:hypothetical protein BB8028_0002g06820 [Beauveria bassiana]